ncbi:hypothetical protein D3C84_1138150 [compost metagenome]
MHERFLAPGVSERPMVFEVFTDSDEESTALEAMMKMNADTKGKMKALIKSTLGDGAIGAIKKIIKN